MSALLSWAQSANAIRARLVSGPAGAGKSRLAADLCQRLRDRSWSTAFVSLDPGDQLLVQASTEGTLIVIEDPEQHSDAMRTLLRDVARLGEANGNRLRLLFLSRQNVGYWQSYFDEAQTSRIDHSIDLGPLPAKEAYRLFCQARQQVAARAPLELVDPPSEQSFLEWQGRAKVHLRALMIVASAIDSVERTNPWEVGLSARDVVIALVRRELVRLRLESTGLHWTPNTLSRILAMAAVAGGLSTERLRQLAESSSTLELGTGQPQAFVDDLRRTGRLVLDPSSGGLYLPPPTPDLLAAALAWEVFGERPDLASAWLWQAIAAKVNAGIDRLGRLIYDSEITLKLSQPLISEWLCAALENNLQRCKAVLEAFSNEQLPNVLVRPAEVVWRSLLDHETDSLKRSQYLSFYAIHLAEAGAIEASHQTIQQAVAILRRLVEADPHRFEPELARCLSRQALVLRDSRSQHALEAISEAVEIRRRLPHVESLDFDADLAASLIRSGLITILQVDSTMLSS